MRCFITRDIKTARSQSSKFQKNPLLYSKLHSGGQFFWEGDLSITKVYLTTFYFDESLGCPLGSPTTLAANLMARAWNESPTLRNSTSLNAAKLAASNWARSIKI